MLKYISQVYENHSNNPIKFIVHLLISSGGDVLFSLGDKKHKKLIFLRGLSVITLALGAVIIKSYLSLESFVNHCLLSSLNGARVEVKQVFSPRLQ